MKRVCVIGCGGAGKSHLAKRLGKALGLPLVHLDQIYWQPGWVPMAREEFRAKMAGVYAQEEWIWRFRRDELPGTLEVLGKFPEVKVYGVRNRGEVEEVFGVLVG